jgi:Flp pilus assembly protein TadD
VSRNALVSGSALFGGPATGEALSPETIFAIDDEMRAFVRGQTDGIDDPETKLRRLLEGMRDRGLLSLDYLASATQTVRDTFYDRQGNCLSFTMLFVTLAREAGLDVSYQMVDIPPSWSATEDIVTRNNHINAAVMDGGRIQFVVDFNAIASKGNYDTYTVGDDYALALFYNNIGAAAFVQEDYQRSVINFQHAIEAYPGVSGPWNNLAVLYSQHHLPEYAESAYLEAFAVDPSDPSVLTNLKILYEAIGNDALAEVFRKRARYYQLRNPYYHYALASDAYDSGRFEEALDRIRKAIRLKRDEHQFYFLRGMTYFELGDQQRADDNFAQARRYAQFAEVRAQYDVDIVALTGG